MKIADLYQTVTNNIIRDLEAGVAPWTKPWKNGKATGVMPHNGATHRPYHGVNVVLLWAEREAKGYSTSNWMTYRQALGLGGQVRAREKSTTVVFTKKLHVKDKETEEERTVGMLRTYAVFNEDQIDGLTTAEPEILAPEQSIEAVEAFLDAAKADVRIGGNRACYVPSHDFIALPPKLQFKGLEHFYATSLHEHVHYADLRIMPRRCVISRLGVQNQRGMSA
jgi:antirestriction protein ArdC